MTYEQAAELATKIGPKITAAAKNKIVLTDDAKVRTLMAMATATKESLLTAKSGLDGQTKALKDRKADQPATAFAAGTALAIGSLLENIVSYATILRAQYAFATASATTNAEAALTALVLGQMAAARPAVTFVRAPVRKEEPAGSVSPSTAARLPAAPAMTTVSP